MYACTVVFLQNLETSTPHCSWQTLRGINWHIKKLSVPRTALRTRRRRPACSDIVCIISSKSYYARAALYGKCPKAQSPIGIRIYVDVLHLQFGSIRFNHNSIINHISFLSFIFLYILVFPAEPWTYTTYMYIYIPDLARSYSGHFMRNVQYIFTFVLCRLSCWAHQMRQTL